MADREKIEKGLRICTSKEPCNGCPYLNERNCSLSMVADTLALLKEQKPVKAIPTRMKVVRTYKDIEYNYCCGGCGSLLRAKWVACPCCGKAVKWK